MRKRGTVNARFAGEQPGHYVLRIISHPRRKSYTDLIYAMRCIQDEKGTLELLRTPEDPEGAWLAATMKKMPLPDFRDALESGKIRYRIIKDKEGRCTERFGPFRNTYGNNILGLFGLLVRCGGGIDFRWHFEFTPPGEEKREAMFWRTRLGASLDWPGFDPRQRLFEHWEEVHCRLREM